MTMDIRTILLVGALVCLTLAFIMVYYSLARKTYPGFHHWTAGILSAGTGAVLVSMRAVLPDFLTIVLGNFMVLVMTLLMTYGLTLFLNIKFRYPKFKAGVLLGFILTFIWGTYVTPSLYLRIIVLHLAMTIFLAETLYISLRYIPSMLGEQDWLLVFSLFFTNTASILRIGITVSCSGPIAFLKDTGQLQALAILLIILGVVACICSFFILHTHRMEKDLIQAKDEIEKLANVDGLSNLFNRRYFDIKLRQEFRRMNRLSQPISLIIADIDCFKLFNDTYGHQAGDYCIKEIASALRKAAGRVSDVAARYGGEEFVVLLPNTDTEGAMKVACEIKRLVLEKAIPHETSTASDKVTVSMGVATLIPNKSMSHDLLVTLADQALYRSKKSGRNQIHADMRADCPAPAQAG